MVSYISAFINCYTTGLELKNNIWYNNNIFKYEANPYDTKTDFDFYSRYRTAFQKE